MKRNIAERFSVNTDTSIIRNKSAESPKRGTSRRNGDVDSPFSTCMPSLVEFEVISKCNLRCRYCYAMPFSHVTPKLGDLETLFDQTKTEVNPRTVVLVGGEPFLRLDIIQVLESAWRTFGHFGVSTNGTCFGTLTEADWSALRRICVASGEKTLQVSLDSFDADCNDKTRGLTHEVIHGLSILEQHHVPFMLGIVLTTSNARTLVQSVERALRDFHYLTSIYIGELIPAKHLADAYSTLKVDLISQRSVIADITNMRQKLKRTDVQICTALDGTLEYYLPAGKVGRRPVLEAFNQHGECWVNATKATLPTCRAGLTRAGVFASGAVSPCVFLRDVIVGNLYQESWNEIWERARQRHRGIGNLERVDGRQCWHDNVVSGLVNVATDGREKTSERMHATREQHATRW